ncbi:MAG: hypothetical protein JSW21_04990 [Gammaproteobacteria bacterium]|nr:MAG: hypothetical protein JSW21_04990 [Gammaproteobacteria bacterium]
MNIEFVPITFFLSIALIAGLVIYFRYRTRSEIQRTLRSAIDKGQELTPEILERIGEPRRPANADLRVGVIAIALGVGCAAFGLVLGEEDAVQPLLAIAAFPFLVGLAYLSLWRFREKVK